MKRDYCSVWANTPSVIFAYLSMLHGAGTGAAECWRPCYSYWAGEGRLRLPPAVGQECSEEPHCAPRENPAPARCESGGGGRRQEGSRCSMQSFPRTPLQAARLTESVHCLGCTPYRRHRTRRHRIQIRIPHPHCIHPYYRCIHHRHRRRRTAAAAAAAAASLRIAVESVAAAGGIVAGTASTARHQDQPFAPSPPHPFPPLSPSFLPWTHQAPRLL